MKNLLEQVKEKFTKKQIIISSAVVGLLLVGGVTTGIVKHNTTVHAQQVAQKKEANRLIEVASKTPSDQAIKTAKDAISKLTDKKVKEKDTTLLKAIEERLAIIKTAQTAVKDYQAHATDATKQKTAQNAINGIKDKNDAKVKAELQKAFDSANKQAQEAAKAEQANPETDEPKAKHDDLKDQDQTLTVEKVTPSIDIEKANGKVPDAGNGNHTDKDNNVGVNDHDTEATYFEIEPKAQTKIFFRGTNTGTEPLTHIKVVDKTIKGSVNIENMSFTFNNKKLTVNKAGDFELDGKLLVLQPKETIVGSGMLGSLPNGELHGDEVTIDGVGVYSKKPVSDADKWYGKTKDTPIEKVLNIFLPKTGDTKTMTTALGGWLLLISLVLAVTLNERKRHTLTKAIVKFKRQIKI